MTDVYAATLYHDTELDAAVESDDIGYFETLESAVAAINANRSDYWQTGGVIHGELIPAVFGVSPERFEDDGEGSWFVGLDGKPDR